MLKLFFQIIVFILALVYIGGRAGLLSTQMRNAQKNKFELPRYKSNLPNSVWVARQYIKTIACDTFGIVQIELTLKDRTSGRMATSPIRTGEGPACKFTAHFRIQYEQDHIKVHYPLGTLDGEARCPIACRYTTFLRTQFSATFQDTTINEQAYRLLQFPDFRITEL